jgi:hypothetical protein
MLHKAEEWNLIGRVPKFKLLREYGSRLRLDDDAERKLLAAAKGCNWRRRTFERRTCPSKSPLEGASAAYGIN